VTILETDILTKNNIIRFSIQKQDEFYSIKCMIVHMHQNISSD